MDKHSITNHIAQVLSPKPIIGIVTNSKLSLQRYSGYPEMSVDGLKKIKKDNQIDFTDLLVVARFKISKSWETY